MGIEVKLIFSEDRSTPGGVKEELELMQADYELGNDSYLNWYEDSMADSYPETAKYFKDNDIVDYLIRFSW